MKPNPLLDRRRCASHLTAGCCFAVLVLLPALVVAQPFDSGSDGSDGALAISASTVFDPTDFDPVLDADGDGIYHFTTITIEAGAQVELHSEVLGTRPVIWLAQGDIVIDGILHLDGQSVFETPGVPNAGAGGFGGGAGLSPTRPAQPGAGPGGGLPGSDPGSPGGGAGHVLQGGDSSCTPPGCGAGGDPYGNSFLQPLLGGSGGAGGGGTDVDGSSSGSAGGAGGGAILLASSTKIALNGSIRSSGGSGDGLNAPSGGGSGGSIRLMAPLVEGGGSVAVYGGLGGGSTENGGDGSAGRVRIEAYDSAELVIDPPEADVRYATPGNVLPSASAPFVRIAAIDGEVAPSSPSGSYAPADVTVDAAGPITVALEAGNIPLGTEILLTLTSEDEGTIEVTSTPLAGTLEASTATATVSLPPGFSRFTLFATWTP